MSIFGTLAALLHSSGTFFRYQIKLCASSFSVTTFYNSQIWHPDLMRLLSHKFTGISHFLYIFPFAIASTSNLFTLKTKLYPYKHSLCSLTRTPKFSIIQIWKSMMLESSLPSVLNIKSVVKFI